MSRFKDLLARGVSSIASGINLPRFAPVQRQLGVTGNCGAKGERLKYSRWARKEVPYRRIIAYTRLGPFFRQVGVFARSDKPIMQGHYTHRMLHATKGWREFTDLPWKLQRAGIGRPA